MKEIIGIILTLLTSTILIILSELFKVSAIIAGIVAVSVFILILIFLFSYYLKQINNKIDNNKNRINEISKNLNIHDRLIKLETDIEWLKKEGK